MLLKKKQEKSKAEWHITLCPQVINNVLYIGGGGGEGLQRIAPNHSPCPELIMTYSRAKLKLILLINTTFPVKTKTNISFKSHNSIKWAIN